jgi:lipoprotein NlpD
VTGRSAGRRLLVWLVVTVAGCSNPGPAPVVERAVWDEPDYASARPPAPAPKKPAAASERPAQPRAEPQAHAPDWRPESYVVKKGDTLYSIALDHGLAYRDVAAWNSLTDPNVIKVGQTLKLVPPPGWREEEDGASVVARPVAPAPALEGRPLEQAAPPEVKTGPKGVKLAYSPEALARLRGTPPAPAPPAASARSLESAQAGVSPPAKSSAAPSQTAPAPIAPRPAPSPPVSGAPAAVSEVDGVGWAWPARGPLLHAFNQGANPKGVAIGGGEGQPVLASAPGKVVYAGSGLRGYGKLIIIKHNSTYLSVYAHNRALLVKEGDHVSGGQRIAEMGSSDAEQVGLHFEIRRLGKPVDPLKYLPQQGEG